MKLDLLAIVQLVSEKENFCGQLLAIGQPAKQVGFRTIQYPTATYSFSALNKEKICVSVNAIRAEVLLADFIPAVDDLRTTSAYFDGVEFGFGHDELEVELDASAAVRFNCPRA